MSENEGNKQADKKEIKDADFFFKTPAPKNSKKKEPNQE